ncbi:MAG: SIMPL domain-containing protein, partial [Muribaculum sp.]|nr:SIMPL domain-containing protein [Muribaculum sp.]
MSNENIIKVTGLAMMKVSPDTSRINITIGRVIETYDAAYEQGKRNLNAINAVVVEAGLSENDVKTGHSQMSVAGTIQISTLT